MKRILLKHMTAAIAALFTIMFAMPQQAMAQNTVTIDGDPAGAFTINLWNGSITAPKHGDGKPHTISINYSNDPTGIDTPTADVPARKQGIYNLQGVRLGTSLDGLPKGIYIVDGKKVVKK